VSLEQQVAVVDALALDAILLQLAKQLLFFFGYVDVGILEGVHFDVDVGAGAEVGLQGS